LTLPDIGDFADVAIIEILVSPGDRIQPEQSLLTLESDKATMEIPAPFGGVVKEVLVAVGEKVNRGDRLFTVEGAEDAETVAAVDEAPEPASAEPPAAAPAAQRPEPPSAPPSTPSPEPPARRPGEAEPRQAPILPRPADLVAIARGRKPHASPAVRRFARELGVDLAQVKGSGPKGRVRKDDVQGFVKQALSAGGPSPAAGLPFALPPAPDVDFSRFGPVEQVALSRIKRRSGAHLHRCWLTVPHVTQFDEADITELEAFRAGEKGAAETKGVKLTLLPFLVKAAASALGTMPVLKSSLGRDGEHLIQKQYTHIGVAVATRDGLVVPVVRDADRKGVFELARELAELSAKARDGKLLPGDMQGGCFSISSLGGIGGTAFTPIVNAPEVAILGVSRAVMRPVWDGTQFVPRLMLPLSLSYDHRVVDGAEGVQFTRLLGDLLGDIRRLLL
jgi:pyruvate dehydrogenase E2 component (dihydrolipoamide acetyltransferase)